MLNLSGNKSSELPHAIMKKIESANDPRLTEFVGTTIGKLRALRFVGMRVAAGGRRFQEWEFECDCGNKTITSRTRVENGYTTSCGCVRLATHTTHGFTRHYKQHPLYGVWATMIQRCTNPKVVGYRNYGARGIGVCSEWMSFENFAKDMLPTYLPGLTLDRIDNSRGYSSANCKWSTRLEQGRNKRNNRSITFQGETLTLLEWSRKCRVSHSVLHKRLKRETIESTLGRYLCAS